MKIITTARLADQLKQRVLLQKFVLIGIILVSILSACNPLASGQGMLPATMMLSQPQIACGPLQVNQANPRYFSNGCGKIVYLSGSHTWTNFQEIDNVDPIKEVFDFEAYLDLLEENRHNFFRLWRWEEVTEAVSPDSHYWFDPTPYLRTGPGTALDGKPKFDLALFNQAYFDRLRERVTAAGDRGIYVSIMLFNGWSVENKDGVHNPWPGHPFNPANNVNGINGDPNMDGRGIETHTLLDPAILALQEAYVRKVIDTVNDLDNVLYEISNESQSSSKDWQYYLINYIKAYEAGKPKQHPVGMTVAYPNGSNTDLYASPADWISPNGDVNDPVIADGKKVILGDTDHLCGTCGDVAWVWRSLTRGQNPILMDPYNWFEMPPKDLYDPIWNDIRRNIGYAMAYANRMKLEWMTPRGDLCSTGYCLANPAADGGAEYLVFLPSGGSVEVNLTPVVGQLYIEWLNPSNGKVIEKGSISGGGEHNFVAPFFGSGVLYLSQVQPIPANPAFRRYIPIVQSFLRFKTENFLLVSSRYKLAELSRSILERRRLH